MKSNLNQEKVKKAKPGSGFLGLLVLAIIIALIILDGIFLLPTIVNLGAPLFIILMIAFFLSCIAFSIVQPNQSLVLTLFGKYKGTIKEAGFYWLNPFYGKRKLSLRACNLNPDPIKVNDSNGNPIMIGQVLVWRVKDTYKACFEIDTPDNTNTSNKNASSGAKNKSLMAYENFVRVQSDAALRSIAGEYPYDTLDSKPDVVTLRSGGEEINNHLERELSNRLEIAGIEIIEASINYLAYSPEIANAMLRRQQAEAIIAAREKIVEGAVSMVEMALDEIKDKNIIELDEDKKATMISNLLVVLCADEAASPVINTGSLY